MRKLLERGLLAFALAAPLAAHAQSAVSGSVELSTDERRRGISWSEGRAAPAASLYGSAGGFDAGVRVVAARDSDRHGGAEAAASLQLGYTRDVGGGFSVNAVGFAHLFAGARGDLDYVELGAGAGYLLGPLQLDAGLRYAPRQSAIGGDNLYLFADASAGIPTTPFTVRAGIGRSSGDTRNPFLAARLRPGGDYTDWRIGVDHVTGPLTIGVDYVGTDVEEAASSPYADAGNSGDRILGRVSFTF